MIVNALEPAYYAVFTGSAMWQNVSGQGYDVYEAYISTNAVLFESIYTGYIPNLAPSSFMSTT